MNCKCIENIEAQTLKMKYKNSTVERAQFISAALMGSKLQMVTTSEIEVTLVGVKKKYNVPIAHSYCPFCGKKIEKS
jgi:hypothetical protein